jgi:formate dehydrogenase assembly factor FdhD
MAEHVAPNGGILEPKGKPPAVLRKQVEVKCGVARDALAVAIQVGDNLIHCSPEDAEELAQGLLMSARDVRMFKAQRDGQILRPGA